MSQHNSEYSKALQLAAIFEGATELHRLHDELQMTQAAYESACGELRKQETLIAELVKALQKIADLDRHPMLTSEVIETARATLSKAKEQV